jgi:hypothetical protein
MRCMGPGCPKPALSVDGGWIACEEHERHHEIPHVDDPSVEQYITAMHSRRLAEHWELQEHPGPAIIPPTGRWIPRRRQRDM